ncbi:MAG: putative metal-binding motif-containing protein, partial [Thermodesulfobacteriota bacterium]
MNRFMKLSLTAAAVTAMSAAPPVFAGDGNVDISLTPVPAALGNAVKITAVGSSFNDALVRGEVDVRNAADDKVLDDAVMTQVNDSTFTYSYTVPANEDAGRWEVKVKLFTDHDGEDEKVRMTVEEGGGTTPPPPACADNDNDGFTDAACGGTDCNDNNAAINPGASETCGDGVDQDCSGVDLSCPPPVCPDSDNDGYTDAACGGTDCNDNNAAINPGAS